MSEDKGLPRLRWAWRQKASGIAGKINKCPTTTGSLSHCYFTLLHFFVQTNWLHSEKSDKRQKVRKTRLSHIWLHSNGNWISAKTAKSKTSSAKQIHPIWLHSINLDNRQSCENETKPEFDYIPLISLSVNVCDERDWLNVGFKEIHPKCWALVKSTEMPKFCKCKGDSSMK